MREYTRKYVFDKLGNIQQLKQLGTNGLTRNFTYNTGGNTLQKVETATPILIEDFTYDNCENQLTENTTRQFEWDVANRLVLFKNQIGSSEPSVIAQYLYDSAGNRVKKIVRKQGGGYEIRTYIDGIFEHFTDETDEQNTVHIMDDQSRVATIRIGDAMGDTTPAIKYELENNIYSSMVVLDNMGAIVNTQEYYPFGETSFGSYGKKCYQYIGKERDEESGLYYYGARYYSPWTARFISCDPLSAKYAQLSPYNYSDNNPVNDFDIDGMQNNNTEGSEQGGNTNTDNISKGSESITLTGRYNKDSHKEMHSKLPENPADGDSISFNYSEDNWEHEWKYSEKNSTWTGTSTYEVNGTRYESGAISSYTPENNPSQVKENSTTEKGVKGIVKTIDDVVSNKTVGDVVSGGGLLSQVVDISAYQARKETIQNTKKNIKTARKLDISVAGLKDKGSKILKKIYKTSRFIGKVLGITSAISNFSNAGKEWDKGNKGKAIWSAVKGAVDIGLSFAKMNPVVGFVAGFAWTLISFW